MASSTPGPVERIAAARRAFDPELDAMIERADVALLEGDVPDPDEGW